jgi:hypothetical protein
MYVLERNEFEEIKYYFPVMCTWIPYVPLVRSSTTRRGLVKMCSAFSGALAGNEQVRVSPLRSPASSKRRKVTVGLSSWSVIFPGFSRQ